jgi:hypothetical protein
MNDFSYKTGYRKYTLNENYFDIIDSEAKAYFLGFIFADGCVSLSNQNFLLRLEIHIDDVEIIESFKMHIQSTSPIKISKSGKYVNIRLFSKKLVHDLIQLGCTERKSLTLKFPDINEKYLNHFMRGYFDGDGSLKISKRKYDYPNRKRETEYKTFSFDVMSSFDFIPKYQEYLCKYCDLNFTKIINRENNCYISYVGRNNLKRIFEFLYKDATIYLKRKYNRFIEMKNYE